MAFEGYANIIADSLMQGGAGLGRGIGEGLSGLGSGIAGGMMKHAANKREDAQLAEKRRQDTEDWALNFSKELSLMDAADRRALNRFGLEQAHDINMANLGQSHRLGLTADQHRRLMQETKGYYDALAKNDPETQKLMSRIAALELQLNQVPKQPGAPAPSPAGLNFMSPDVAAAVYGLGGQQPQDFVTPQRSDYVTR